jgi:hypothetical protein
VVCGPRLAKNELKDENDNEIAVFVVIFLFFSKPDNMMVKNMILIA